MKRLLSLTLLATGLLSAQTVYTASKTTILSTSAEVITIQQLATGSQVVRFISAYMDSTAACSLTIERNGAFASTTTLTPIAANPDVAPAPVATAYSASNVGTGSVITRASVSASGSIVIDLSRVIMQGNGISKNLTLRTSSCTGTVNIVITYSESNS